MTQSRNFGRYEITSPIGQGGMASVYLAYDPLFERDVALKVLPRELVYDGTFRERFNREARTIARLEHYAIVPVYDFGEHEGQPYLVMRYMAGGSLAARIKEGAMPLLSIAPILKRLADALDYSHSLGVIHRDLKPGNVLFDNQDNAFLSDYGIAKLTESTQTLTGSAIIGTPAYMSPEQVQGEVDIDGRSDVYALGVMLFQMLTGELPFKADTPVKQLMAHVLNPAPNVLDVRQDLPPECAAVVSQALAKGKEDRYATAGNLANDISMIATKEMARPSMPSAPVEQPEALPTRNVAPVIEPAEAAPTVLEAAAEAMPGLVKTAVVQPESSLPPPAPSEKKKWPTWFWLVGMALLLVLLLGGLWRVLAQPGADSETAAGDQTPMGAYIQNMWVEGWDVTSLAYRPGSWAVVMSNGADYGQQIWHVTAESPLPKIRESWPAGYAVTDVAYGEENWVVVMSDNVDLGRQLWHFTPDSPKDFIESRWREGYDVTSLAYGSGGWAMVLSQDSNLGEQKWHSTPDSPLAFIQNGWADGFDVTSLAYGDGVWMVIMSRNADLGEQVFHKTAVSPLAFLQEQWPQGFDATSLASGAGQWAVVMSDEAALGRQVWHTAAHFR